MFVCFSAKITTSSSTEADVECDGPQPPIQCTETPCEVESDTEDTFSRNVPDNADMYFAYATTEGRMLTIILTYAYVNLTLKWSRGGGLYGP